MQTNYSLINTNITSALSEDSRSDIGHEQIQFFDSELKNTRDLLVWFPLKKTEEQNSVIIVSHGYTGHPNDLKWIIDPLVRKGYIVIGIKHDDNDKEIDLNHWKRARDIKEIIQVYSNSKHGKKSDLNNIGFVGFSLGGTTGIWTSGARSTNLKTLVPPIHWASASEFGRVDEGLDKLDKDKMSQNWRISGIRAAFLIAPAWSWIFKEEDLKQIGIPVHLTAGQSDSIVNPEFNAAFFAKHISGATCDLIPNATHFTFIDSDSAESRVTQRKVAENGIEFFSKNLRVRSRL